MKKGKVVIIGGNKRSGKTTLAIKLHNEFNYNYYNFDMFLDSLEETFDILNDHNDDKYINLLNEMVKRSLDDAKNYGVNCVYEYIFTPKQLNDFKYKNDVKIYFLANIDANNDNIKDDMFNFSKSFDWPLNATNEDIERNINEILNKNDLLISECKKYNFNLINTSRLDNRNVIIDNLAKEINKDL